MEWLPVLTFALGQLVIVVLAYIQNRWAKDREEQAQEATREEVRREFQRKSLLELQAAIHDLGRAWSRMYHEDDMAFRTTGKWGGNLYSEDWSDRESDARIRVRIHSSRVIDKSARETSEMLLRLGGSYTMSKDDGEATRIFVESLGLLNDIADRAGEVLRTL